MDKLIAYAMQFVGVPYKWGGASPMEGLDCSGLVQEILRFSGEDPPGDQTAQGLYDWFSAPGRGAFVYGPGALAFYGESVLKITHVGFCLDQYRMIEAAGGGSRTTDREAAIRDKAFVRGALIKSRKDFLCVIKPNYLQIGYRG